MRPDDVLAHVLRMRTGVADAVYALDRVDGCEQLAERPRPALRRPQVAAVGVDVLAEQRDLAHAVGREALHLDDELLQRPPDLPAARRGHDAVRAAAVAADRDLHPPLVAALAADRQVAREALELEEALRGDRVAGEELGELVDLTGAEGDVDERELAEDVVLDRLRPAPADADDALGIAPFERRRLAQMGDEALVGLLADRAGVEEDEVRIPRVGRLAVAERLEHALHALRVVLVHLAAERRDVVALHAANDSHAKRPRRPQRARMCTVRPIPDVKLPSTM